jgi:hypothetical protein
VFEDRRKIEEGKEEADVEEERKLSGVYQFPVYLTTLSVNQTSIMWCD